MNCDTIPWVSWISPLPRATRRNPHKPHYGKLFRVISKCYQEQIAWRLPWPPGLFQIVSIPHHNCAAHNGFLLFAQSSKRCTARAVQQGRQATIYRPLSATLVPLSVAMSGNRPRARRESRMITLFPAPAVRLSGLAYLYVLFPFRSTFHM